VRTVIDRLIRLPASLKAREIEEFIMVCTDRRDAWWGFPTIEVLYTVVGYSIIERMAHTRKAKDKLLIRVRRIRGQVDAIERALESEEECTSVLQLMAACRGALNSLMAEVMEGHVRFHVLSPEDGRNSPHARAAEELIEVVRAYLK
jgi:DNA-binding FrmR family transcriptional regulator